MRHHLPAISIAALFALAVPVVASAPCDLIDQVSGNSAAQPTPVDATCSAYLGVDATTGVSCYWAFGFRDASAMAFAETLWASVTACRPGRAGAEDRPVNHPDSFALRIWETERGRYRVSVKDKGAQNRTLVFLGFEPARLSE